jgi:hypothetical protein
MAHVHKKPTGTDVHTRRKIDLDWQANPVTHPKQTGTPTQNSPTLNPEPYPCQPAGLDHQVRLITKQLRVHYFYRTNQSLELSVPSFK